MSEDRTKGAPVYRRQHGQAMLEYALILVLVVIGFGIALAATGPAIGNVFSNQVYNLLGQTTTPRAIGGPADFWLTVTWVATQTPQEHPLPTRTLPPPSKTPTAGPSPTNTPITPTTQPPPTDTPPPTATPSDFSFVAPWTDSADDMQYWRVDSSVFLGSADWYGEYYANTSLSGTPDFGLYNGDIDPSLKYKINFDWGNGTPKSGWLTDNWSVAFTRQIYLENDTRLNFSGISDDGMRIWILGGAYGDDPTTCHSGVTPGASSTGRKFYGDSYPNDCLIYDDWNPHSASGLTGSRTIPAGSYTLRVDYVEYGGNAVAKVDITGPSANPDDTQIDSGFNPVAGPWDCNWEHDQNGGTDADTVPWMWEEYNGGNPKSLTSCYLELRGSVEIPTSMDQPELSFWDIWDVQNQVHTSVQVAEYNTDRTLMNWINVPLHYSSGMNYNWTRQVVDLTDVRGDGTTTTDDNFVGKKVALRFNIAVVNGSGTNRWYIDTITIDQTKRKTFHIGEKWNLDSPDQKNDFITSGWWQQTNKLTHGGMSFEDSYGPNDVAPGTYPFTQYPNFSESPGSTSYALNELRVHSIEFNGFIDLDDPLGNADLEGDTYDPLLSFWYAYNVGSGTGIEVEYTLDPYSAGNGANWKPVPNGGTLIARDNNATKSVLSMQFVEIKLNEIVNAEGLTAGNRKFRLRIAETVARNANRLDGLWIDDIYLERMGPPQFAAYPFCDDAEGGTASWLLDGSWGLTYQQARSDDFDINCNVTPFGGGGQSFTDTPGVDGGGNPNKYLPSTDSSMTLYWPFDLNNDTPGNAKSPNCNLTPSSQCVGGGVAAVDPVMTFWFIHDIQSGDSFSVEYKQKDAPDTAWTRLWRYSASMATLTAASSSRTRTSLAWEYVEVDLTPVMASFNPSDANLEDDDMIFRFRLQSDGSSWSVGDGVYIDNIAIKERSETVYKLWASSGAQDYNKVELGPGNMTAGGKGIQDDFDIDTNWAQNWLLGGQWEVINWEQRNGIYAVHDSATDLNNPTIVQDAAPPNYSDNYVNPASDTFSVLQMQTIIDMRGTTVEDQPTLYFWSRYHTYGTNNHQKLLVQVSYERNGPPVGSDSYCAGNEEQCYEHEYGWSEWQTVWVPESSRTYTWQRMQVDLSAYAIQTGLSAGKRIRIRFVSDNLDNSTKYDGWYIDKVSINFRSADRIFSLPFYDGARNMGNWIGEGTWGLSPEFFKGTGGGPATMGGALWNYYWWRCDGQSGAPYCDNLASNVPGWHRSSDKFKVGADWFLRNTADSTACPSQCGVIQNIINDFGSSGPYGSSWATDRFLGRWVMTTPLVDSVNLNPGTYSFIIISDDGVRMRYEYATGGPVAGGPPVLGNGSTWNIIDNWNDTSAMPNQGVATLVGGETYKFTIEYYEKTGDSTIILSMGGNSFSFTDSPKQGPGVAFPEIPAVPYGNSSLILNGLLDLRGINAPYIQYYTYYELGGTGRFEVSANGGFSWTQAGLDPNNAFDSPNMGGYWMPNQGPWQRRLHDLSAYSGNTIGIRFRLDRQWDSSTDRKWQSPTDWLVSWWVVDIGVDETCSTPDTCGAQDLKFVESNGSTQVAEATPNTADTYTVQIIRNPAVGNVVVNLSTDGQCTVSPTTLTFSAGLTPQTVQVKAVNDTKPELAVHECIITHVVDNSLTADTGYHNVDRRLSAQVIDNDGPSTMIASETFNSYNVGQLDSQNGGIGWIGQWVADPGQVSVVAPSTPLSRTVSGAGGGTISGGTRALYITPGNNDQLMFRGLGAQSGDNVYFSFLLRPDSGTSFDNNDFMAFWFDSVADGDHTDHPSIGIKADGGSGPDMMVRMFQGNERYGGPNLSANTTYLIVGRLSKSTPGAANNYTDFQLWVNPAFGDSNNPSAEAKMTSGSLFPDFTILGLRMVNMDSSDNFYIDELRVGGSWADVVP